MAIKFSFFFFFLTEANEKCLSNEIDGVEMSLKRPV